MLHKHDKGSKCLVWLVSNFSMNCTWVHKVYFICRVNWLDFYNGRPSVCIPTFSINNPQWNPGKHNILMHICIKNFQLKLKIFRKEITLSRALQAWFFLSLCYLLWNNVKPRLFTFSMTGLWHFSAVKCNTGVYLSCLSTFFTKIEEQ